MKTWRDYPIQEIYQKDSLYPKELLKITGAPKRLFVRGNIHSDIFKKTISIVGSRKISNYGVKVTNMLVPELVAHDYTIISGFMYGTDSQVHQNCTKYGGKTIAVLGNGLNYLYPRSNDKLYTDILKNNGLVISEYEPEFKATLWTFAQRNRIVSALSTYGIIIVEADIKSGSLLTAKYGLKQNKEIYAIPGPITSTNSRGTNYLIQNNLAKIITNISDLIPSVTQKELFSNIDLNPEEKKIINLLQIEELSIDDLSLKLNTDIATLSTQISLLSLKNIIEEKNNKLCLVINP
jgi:DNA processing protein